MKFLGTFVFLVLMCWTWNLIHSAPSIAFETHAAIQERLADAIREAVLAKKPDAKDLSPIRVWTEQLAEGKMIAHFEYTFSEKAVEGGEVHSKVQGTGALDRQGFENDGTEKWLLSDVKISNDSVVFEEALEIRANSQDTK